VVAGNLGSGNPDYGFYIAQYFRTKTNKFGDPVNNIYIPTGTITEYLETASNIYGDTFTEKTYLKHRIVSAFDNASGITNTCGGQAFGLQGFGGGIGMYSQNRANSQMIQRNDTSFIQWQYPVVDITLWLSGTPELYTSPVYNSGYNSQQGVTADTAFNPNLPNNPATPARFWWSLEKPEDSLSDQYTVILPLNFRDEDLTNGAIWQTIVANQEFFTIQQRNVVRQYIEDTSLVNSSEAQVVFGSSGVANQRGNQLSGYGTIHGFGVIRGKSAAGKDTFYYLDTYQGKAMRYEPSDGHKCISDAHNMRWFFNNYLQPFVNEALTPANGQGICGYWDDQNSEAVWTVRAMKQVQTYISEDIYEKFVEVFYQPSQYSTFEQTGEIYISLIDNNTSLPTDTTKWQLVPHYSNAQLVNGLYSYNYWNEYTIAYNEVKDKFVTRYSWLPMIYIKIGKNVMMPRPVENLNKCYLAYGGTEYGVFFTDDTAVTSLVSQVVDSFISGMIVNYDVSLAKRAMAIEIITETTPYAMTFETKQYSSSLQQSDFQQRFDYYISSVHDDTSNNSRIFGQYISVSLTFAAQVYQNFFSFILKCLIKNRTYKS